MDGMDGMDLIDRIDRIDRIDLIDVMDATDSCEGAAQSDALGWYAAFLQNAEVGVLGYPERCSGLVCGVPLGHGAGEVRIGSGDGMARGGVANSLALVDAGEMLRRGETRLVWRWRWERGGCRKPRRRGAHTGVSVG